MGSYQAPAYDTVNEKTLQDVTTPNGTVLLGPRRCVYFIANGIKSALFDGAMEVQAQRADLTWQGFQIASFGLVGTRNVTPEFTQFAQQNQPYRYPYVIRVVGVTQPTVGSAVGYLVTFPPPANPLF